MRRFMTFGPALVVLLTAVATLIIVPETIRRVGYASTDVQMHLARATLADDDILERINAATRAIARAVEPSVVHIAVSTVVPQSNMRRVGAGSGWVFDKQGHIVTNAHVVRDAGDGDVLVQFYDGRAVPAKIVGVDPQTDIAVLSVPAREGLFPATRATNEVLEQGDRVYAFGSPFGFKFSMSEGIIAGVGRDPREIIGAQGYTNFIQTDAMVNPGNSGGPLIDVKGRVVGMNVAIATSMQPRGNGQETPRNEGVSFAIPLDTIESVVPSIIATGDVQRGYLGVRLPDNEDVNTLLKQRRGYDREGVIVPTVTPGTPAYLAGLRDNDVIVAFNGVTTTNPGILRQRITLNKPGDRANIRVWRDGKIDELTVTLGDLAWQRVLEYLGRDYGMILLDEEGPATVARVAPSSAAARDGFRRGQSIVTVAGENVESPEAFLLALYRRGLLGGKPVNVDLIEQNGQRRSLEMRPTE